MLIELLLPSTRAKRKRATEEKKLKLKSPNFLVSTTRLSVRNIPFNLDEKALKALFLQAVKQRATKESPMIKQVSKGVATKKMLDCLT